jgi:hypothetical protein
MHLFTPFTRQDWSLRSGHVQSYVLKRPLSAVHHTPAPGSKTRHLKHNFDGPVKSQKSDDKVNSFRCKARKYEGMRLTYLYAAMTEDAAQRSRWTFYEVVNF